MQLPASGTVTIGHGRVVVVEGGDDDFGGSGGSLGRGWPISVVDGWLGGVVAAVLVGGCWSGLSWSAMITFGCCATVVVVVVVLVVVGLGDGAWSRDTANRPTAAASRPTEIATRATNNHRVRVTVSPPS